jgi:hypothetical protein
MQGVHVGGKFLVESKGDTPPLCRNSGLLFDVLPNSTCDLSKHPSKGRMRPDISLEFGYRRLAAVCLDLAKRAAALVDKARLLLIAEAWLDLADRVSRNRGKAMRASVDPAEHRMVGGTLATREPAPASAAPSRHSRTERFDTGMR